MPDRLMERAPVAKPGDIALARALWVQRDGTALIKLPRSLVLQLNLRDGDPIFASEMPIDDGYNARKALLLRFE